VNTNRIMMRHLGAFLLVGLFCSAGIAAAEPSATALEVEPAPTVYGPGELLVFDITYGPISAGEATLEISDVIDFNGRSCYHIESRTNSNRFFSSFYKVRDRVMSYIAVDSLYSIYFSKRLREGDFRRTVEVVFDHDAGLAHYADGKQVEVDSSVQDVLSAFYHVRNLDLVPGAVYSVPAHSSGKSYDLKVYVHGRETVKTEAGEFGCLVVEPAIEGEGLFKHEGKLTIYISDDANRLPVMIKTKVPVGTIDVELKSYRIGTPLRALELEVTGDKP